MKETYNVKYRQPGQWLWRKLKDVRGDGVEDSFRYFLQQDDTLTYVSLDAEVKFGQERAQVIARKMSKEIGQPVQLA